MLRYYLNNVKIVVAEAGKSIYISKMAKTVSPAKKLDRTVKQRPVRPTRYHHGDLRDALVAAARDILERDGWEALSLRETARRAGVSQAAPYHHFADKTALLAAVAADGFTELTAAMQVRMARAETPATRLNATGVGYVSFAAANPALFRLMFGSRRNLLNDENLASAAAGAFAVLQNAIAGASDPVELERDAEVSLAALRAWSIAHGLAMLIIEAGISPDAYSVKNPEALATLVLGHMRIDRGPAV
jgi:AcrR family transcriptional regulator